jgi:hypothetical protein
MHEIDHFDWHSISSDLYVRKDLTGLIICHPIIAYQGGDDIARSLAPGGCTGEDLATDGQLPTAHRTAGWYHYLRVPPGGVYRCSYHFINTLPVMGQYLAFLGAEWLVVQRADNAAWEEFSTVIMRCLLTHSNEIIQLSIIEPCWSWGYQMGQIRAHVSQGTLKLIDHPPETSKLMCRLNVKVSEYGRCKGCDPPVEYAHGGMCHGNDRLSTSPAAHDGELYLMDVVMDLHRPPIQTFEHESVVDVVWST